MIQVGILVFKFEKTTNIFDIIPNKFKHQKYIYESKIRFECDCVKFFTQENVTFDQTNSK